MRNPYMVAVLGLQDGHPWRLSKIKNLRQAERYLRITSTRRCDFNKADWNDDAAGRGT